ncbi:unnamed protein product [Allacma fusca]|uniref:C2 domain-containing protein n=1 Tax=Allacma fusca TaxID=39272 RepID=A0A8J2KPY9_9HEXA|nr:unnamed protein product [Allacma fusca]
MRFLVAVTVLWLQANWFLGTDGAQNYNVTFMLAGSKIPTQDGYSEADPFVKLYHGKKTASKKNVSTADMTRFGTTSAAHNDENPEWTEVFWFWYEPGTGQFLRLIVRDHDVLNVDDDIGYTDVDTDQLMNSQGQYRANLSTSGALLITRTTPISFKLKANNLPKKDRSWFSEGLSDPYCEVHYRKFRNAANDEYLGVTSTISDVEHPVWPEIFQLSQYQPNAGQYLVFKLYDDDTMSRDDFLGEAVVSVDEMAKKRGASIVFKLLGFKEMALRFHNFHHVNLYSIRRLNL